MTSVLYDSFSFVGVDKYAVRYLLEDRAICRHILLCHFSLDRGCIAFIQWHVEQRGHMFSRLLVRQAQFD
jgi:hypothetical protein